MNLVIDSKQKCDSQVFVSDEVVHKSDTDGTVSYLKAIFSTKNVLQWSGSTWLKKYFNGGASLKKV